MDRRSVLRIFSASTLYPLGVWSDPLPDALTLEETLGQLRTVRIRDGEPLYRFLTNVVPGWISIKNEYQDDFFPLPDDLTIEDVLAAAYEISLRRMKAALGDWSEDLRQNVVAMAGVLCTLARIFKIPKRADYIQKASRVARIVVPGSYGRLLINFSLRPALLESSPTSLTTEALPEPEEFFDTSLLELVRRQRSRE